MEDSGEREVVIMSKEIPNGKAMVRFGVDDNDYQIDDFNKLDEFNMGPNISVDKKGLKFTCKCLQDITIDFELSLNDLSLEIIKTIIDLYNK